MSARRYCLTLALLAGIAAHSPIALSAAQESAAPSAIPRERITQELAAHIRQLSTINTPAMARPDPGATPQPASIGFRTLFTAERSSWPFEFITHTGLFALIAGYQSAHPRALELSGGRATPGELAAAVNDERVIRPFRGGYLLSYPLLIAADGFLDVRDTPLYLSIQGGAVVINQGTLQLHHTRVMPWRGDDDWRAQMTTGPLPEFRPFILSWAGSQTRIEHSELARLGYHAHHSTGITLARHERQTGAAAAELHVSHSQLADFTLPVNAQGARVFVSHSAFIDSRLYGLDITDSQLDLHHSRLTGSGTSVTTGSNVRVRGNGSVHIAHNQFSHARKAAIELDGVAGTVLVTDNHIRHTTGDGLLIRRVTSTPPMPLLIVNNHIQHSGRSAIDLADTPDILLAGNRLEDSGTYAVSYVNSHPGSGGRLVILNNQLSRAGTALIRTEGLGVLGLYDTRFHLSRYQERVLAGDSAAFQGPVMRHLMRLDCDLELSRHGPETRLHSFPVRDHPPHPCPQPAVLSTLW